MKEALEDARARAKTSQTEARALTSALNKASASAGVRAKLDAARQEQSKHSVTLKHVSCRRRSVVRFVHLVLCLVCVVDGRSESIHHQNCGDFE